MVKLPLLKNKGGKGEAVLPSATKRMDARGQVQGPEQGVMPAKRARCHRIRNKWTRDDL